MRLLHVDNETDEQIPSTIRAAFAQCTLLTIAHRLHTVLDYDRLLIIANGEVCQSIHPKSTFIDSNVFVE